MEVRHTHLYRAKRRWDAADRDDRRRLIVEAGLDLLERRRLGGVTIRRLAGRLGVGTMTLYTYLDGQEELLREMARRGFQLLAEDCLAHSTLAQGDWRGTWRGYLHFAQSRPNLYRLMFEEPLAGSPADREMLVASFQVLVDRVRQRMIERGTPPGEAERQAWAAARRFWITLHGMASLAASGRVQLVGQVEELIDDLSPRVSPP